MAVYSFCLWKYPPIYRCLVNRSSDEDAGWRIEGFTTTTNISGVSKKLLAILPFITQTVKQPSIFECVFKSLPPNTVPIESTLFQRKPCTQAKMPGKFANGAQHKFLR